MPFNDYLIVFGILAFGVAIMLFVTKQSIIGGRIPLMIKLFKSKDRRHLSRLKTSLRLEYDTYDHKGISWLTNISQDGFFIFLERRIPAGTEIRMKVALPQSKDININGKIVWCRGFIHWAAGIHFDEVNKKKVNVILSFMNDLTEMKKTTQILKNNVSSKD